MNLYLTDVFWYLVSFSPMWRGHLPKRVAGQWVYCAQRMLKSCCVHILSTRLLWFVGSQLLHKPRLPGFPGGILK